MFNIHIRGPSAGDAAPLHCVCRARDPGVQETMPCICWIHSSRGSPQIGLFQKWLLDTHPTCLIICFLNISEPFNLFYPALLSVHKALHPKSMPLCKRNMSLKALAQACGSLWLSCTVAPSAWNEEQLELSPERSGVLAAPCNMVMTWIMAALANPGP